MYDVLSDPVLSDNQSDGKLRNKTSVKMKEDIVLIVFICKMLIKDVLN